MSLRIEVIPTEGDVATAEHQGNIDGLTREQLIAAYAELMLLYDDASARIVELESDLALASPAVPGLTPAQIERIAILIEEIGESLQASGKVLRHGWKSYHPRTGIPNRVALEHELGDVRASVQMLIEAGDVREKDIRVYQFRKREGIGRYLHHAVTPESSHSKP